MECPSCYRVMKRHYSEYVGFYDQCPKCNYVVRMVKNESKESVNEIYRQRPATKRPATRKKKK